MSWTEFDNAVTTLATDNGAELFTDGSVQFKSWSQVCRFASLVAVMERTNCLSDLECHAVVEGIPEEQWRPLYDVINDRGLV